MSSYSHETAPTRFVEAEGVRFAYRRFGKSGGPTLLFLQYFNANMDDWDPFVTNGFALDRDVILFDNAGIASSGGDTPSTVVEMAREVVAFCHALGLKEIAFISADDDDAKRRVGTVLKAFGYSVIDLGNLRDGGLIQQAGGPLAGRDLLERGEYPE
jgi:hypothetical protein